MLKACFAALLIMLSACDAGNPILGNWRVDADQSPPGAAVGLELSGASELEFLEDRMIAGSTSLSVTYAVEEARVTVITKQGQGTVYEFEPDDRSRMFVDSPLGQIVFRRIQ